MRIDTNDRLDIQALETPFTPQQHVALLCRMLHREGYDDHAAGHLTYLQPDGTMLANPHGFVWDEVRASDVIRIDSDGRVVEGRWTISSAIVLMLELHAARPDAIVGIHQHPRYATIWSALGRIPTGYDQRACHLGERSLAFYREFAGVVTDRESARRNVEGIGDAAAAFLANHGVLVVGSTPEEAYFRAVSVEWRSKQAWHVEAIGGGIPMPRPEAEAFSDVVEHSLDVAANTFACMARREIRLDPHVLD